MRQKGDLMPLSRRLACLILFLTIATGCSSSTDRTDPAIKRDLAHYKAQMAKIVDLETEALEAHKKVTDDPAMNDARYAPFLRETFLPKYENFLEELSRIHPMTDEIIALQKLYLRRTMLLIAGFRDIEKSARTGDAKLLESAHTKDAKSDRLHAQWLERMSKLAKIYPPSK
jgi:hypothetical protein